MIAKHTGKGGTIYSLAKCGRMRLHFLIDRNISALGNEDPQSLARSFFLVILFQQFANTPGMNPDKRIAARVEARILAKNIHGNGKGLEPVAAPGLFLVDDKIQQLASALRFLEGATGNYPCQHFPDGRSPRSPVVCHRRHSVAGARLSEPFQPVNWSG